MPPVPWLFRPATRVPTPEPGRAVDTGQRPWTWRTAPALATAWLAIMTAGCAGPSASTSVATKGSARPAGAATPTAVVRLTGRVEGPAAKLISDMAGSLVANNGGGLVTDNGAGIVANHSAGFAALLALAEFTQPVAGARVVALNGAGREIGTAGRSTGDGSFTLTSAGSPGEATALRATYDEAGRAVRLEALLVAGDPKPAALDPATTLVARTLRAASVASPPPDVLRSLVEATRQAMDARSAVAAAVLPDAGVAQAFDALAAANAPLGAAVQAAASKGVQVTRSPMPGPSPSPAPSASPTPPRAYTVSTLVGGAKGIPGAAAGQPKNITPHGVAVDGAGNVYATDVSNHRICKITPGGTLITLAGGGSAGYADGAGAAAKLNAPQDVGLDAAGNLYVTDGKNNRVRKITPAGQVSTLAGDGRAAFSDGAGPVASFNAPQGLAVAASGDVYVADRGNRRIRRITPAGVVSTVAGDGVAGSANGPGPSAQFQSPLDVAVAPDGTLYVGDDHGVRRILPSGLVENFAGDGQAGAVNGPRATARFAAPQALALDAAGDLYVGDAVNQLIRVIRANGSVETIAGNGVEATKDGPAALASFNGIFGIAVTATGRVYLAEQDSAAIRIIE